MTRRPAAFPRWPGWAGLGAAIALTAPSCTPPPERAQAGPAAAPTLAQTLPLGSRATYQVTDSVRIEADGERVRFTTEAAYSALVRMRFRSAADSLLVDASLTEFEGSLVNPTTGAVHATLADIDGEWTATVDRRGRVTPIELPALSDAFRAVVGTEDLLRTLFLPLPDAPAGVGAQWVDTLRTTDEGARTRQTATHIVSTRVAERAEAAGRTVLILESVIETELEAVSRAETDEPSTQVLRGTIRRRAEWDAGLRRLVRYRATGRLSGQLEVEGLGPVPLSADVMREVVGR